MGNIMNFLSEHFLMIGGIILFIIIGVIFNRAGDIDEGDDGYEVGA